VPCRGFWFSKFYAQTVISTARIRKRRARHYQLKGRRIRTGLLILLSPHKADRISVRISEYDLLPATGRIVERLDLARARHSCGLEQFFLALDDPRCAAKPFLVRLFGYIDVRIGSVSLEEYLSVENKLQRANLGRSGIIVSQDTRFFPFKKLTRASLSQSSFQSRAVAPNSINEWENTQTLHAREMS
jgi:hypothetical protein